MGFIAVVKICLECPQKNDGVDRIHSVISYDSEGNQIKDYQELAYSRDFFGRDSSAIRLEIIDYVASEVGTSKDIIEFEDDID